MNGVLLVIQLHIPVDTVDCPKPCCSSSHRHRWILTVIDHVTCNPEGVPLISISAKIVANKLLTIFTRSGHPIHKWTHRRSQQIAIDKTTVYHAIQPPVQWYVERLNCALTKSL